MHIPVMGLKSSKPANHHFCTVYMYIYVYMCVCVCVHMKCETDHWRTNPVESLWNALSSTMHVYM